MSIVSFLLSLSLLLRAENNKGIKVDDPDARGSRSKDGFIAVVIRMDGRCRCSCGVSIVVHAKQNNMIGGVLSFCTALSNSISTTNNDDAQHCRSLKKHWRRRRCRRLWHTAVVVVAAAAAAAAAVPSSTCDDSNDEDAVLATTATLMAFLRPDVNTYEYGLTKLRSWAHHRRSKWEAQASKIDIILQKLA
jgi:hypothetical protein